MQILRRPIKKTPPVDTKRTGAGFESKPQENDAYRSDAFRDFFSRVTGSGPSTLPPRQKPSRVGLTSSSLAQSAAGVEVRRRKHLVTLKNFSQLGDMHVA